MKVTFIQTSEGVLMYGYKYVRATDKRNSGVKFTWVDNDLKSRTDKWVFVEADWGRESEAIAEKLGGKALRLSDLQPI